MVKVYDMVTYGICEPDSDANSAKEFGTPFTETAVQAPAIALQEIEFQTKREQHPLPLSLTTMDADQFLADAEYGN